MKEIINQWNNVAEKYMEAQEQSEYVLFNKKFVMSRFNDLSGNKVLDLGCGYGFYTDYFRSVGADVVGVDASKEMIKNAKKRYPLSKYFIMDLTVPFNFKAEEFDIVFCNQVLMDLEDVEMFFSECQRILKRGGILYYSIVHPSFYGSKWLKDENGFKYAKLVDKYLEIYKINNDFWGETAHFHRPISYYLNIASKNKLSLVKADEPPVYTRNNSDIPLFLFMEYMKL